MKIEWRETLDGSPTLYHTELDEHYHSTFGAMQESMHVFVQAGLKALSTKELHILEIGFGTGLNCYLTLLEVLGTNQQIRYSAIEKFPLAYHIWHSLHYTGTGGDDQLELYEKLHRSPWNSEVELLPNFILNKSDSDLLEFEFSKLQQVDLVYFDAFSPEKQPELWQKWIFDAIFELMNEEGILVTYCAKGYVRRTLQMAGFKVERIPGPPGKREMIRAIKMKV